MVRRGKPAARGRAPQRPQYEEESEEEQQVRMPKFLDDSDEDQGFDGEDEEIDSDEAFGEDEEDLEDDDGSSIEDEYVEGEIDIDEPATTTRHYGAAPRAAYRGGRALGTSDRYPRGRTSAKKGAYRCVRNATYLHWATTEPHGSTIIAWPHEERVVPG